ncbi:UNVERIFIED_CONTAM: hypothetical protein Sradi_1258400 [Sesamum radiatum]|uniref:Uncharacterized protein n=1 Tax=Sesamum radiatum TaxID=300843 RepID=A0AAW2UM84_SESRA
MEMEPQLLNVSSFYTPYVYVTAPTSPNAVTRSSSMVLYYSAPASPGRGLGDAVENQKASEVQGSSLDGFEFETIKKFSSGMGRRFEYVMRGAAGLKHGQRGDSLATGGPLKLPPRLQWESDYDGFGRSCVSAVSSPKSPRTVCRVPFACKSFWNDDFDPFKVALQKVKKEKRGRNSHQRRSRSYSPFRVMSNCSSGVGYCSQDLEKGNSPMQVQESSHSGLLEFKGSSYSPFRVMSNCSSGVGYCSQDLEKGNSPMQVQESSHSGLLEFKGSSYARWVRAQTREGGLSARRPKSQRRFLFGQRLRLVSTKNDGLDKPTSDNGKYVKQNRGNVSKLQKLRAVLLRYASFGRENRGCKQTEDKLERSETEIS